MPTYSSHSLTKPNNALLLGFVVLKFVLHYQLIHPIYELHRDEFLHLDQANHLAWGYLSVPPVTSWISWLIQFLGNNEFLVHFFPCLFGSLTLVIVWKSIEFMEGNKYALILGGVCILFSSLLRLNLLFQPNTIDVFAWNATYYAFIRFLYSRHSRWLYSAAILFSIGFLNKYNILFLAIGLLPAIVITRERKLFTQYSFYGALLIGLLMVSPNLIWQYNHNFPVFQRMDELASKHLIHVTRSGFLKSQLLYFLGALPIILAALYALLFYPPFQCFRVFFYAFFITMLVFIYFKAKGYYAIGIYPIYIAFGAVYIESILKQKLIRLILLLFPITFIGLSYPYSFPINSPAYIIENRQIFSELGLLCWEDGKEHDLPQDFADMLGWKELASKTDSIFNIINAPQETLVLCDNYGQAGAINYYTKSNIKAVSFHADYIH